jgi:uncharacterized damage-inducible protein DinB
VGALLPRAIIMSEIDRIIDQLHREHRGDPWHGSPLLAILEDVTAAQAAARPLPQAHSIWELVLHITAWKGEVIRRLSGAPAGEPAEGDWPAAADAGEQQWRHAQARLEAVHDELIAAVRKLPESYLFEPIKDPRNRPLGTGVTHYELLHGIVQHDVYHAGQIAMLKRAVQGRPADA